jgi:hypothetical protein
MSSRDVPDYDPDEDEDSDSIFDIKKLQVRMDRTYSLS